jgi:hypothetical protein
MSKGPLQKKHLAAGVLDAALASIATFAAGLTGLNLLGDVDRGVYGIFFAAFFLGSIALSELILVPAQVVAVNKPLAQRLGVTRRSLELAVGPGIIAAGVAPITAILTGDLTSADVVVALAVPTAITTLVSPMQDHVRQLLHIAEKSWHAVAVSAVQLVSITGLIGILLLLDVERAWIPFGSLAAANVISLTVAYVLAGGHRGAGQDRASMTFRSLAASGKWLVLRAATPATLAFVSANIITELAGPEAYGYAEAARQVAQPVTVFSVGLMAVLGPRAVRAGALRDRDAARSNRAVYLALMALGGLAYAAVAGWSWVLNPMTYLIPSAYIVGGLAAATIGANVLVALFLILGRELLGGGKARTLAFISIVAAPALPLAAVTAGTTEAFARPLGYIFEGIIRIAGGGYWLNHHYGDPGAAIQPAPDLAIDAEVVSGEIR